MHAPIYVAGRPHPKPKTMSRKINSSAMNPNPLNEQAVDTAFTDQLEIVSAIADQSFEFPSANYFQAAHKKPTKTPPKGRGVALAVVVVVVLSSWPASNIPTYIYKMRTCRSDGDDGWGFAV